MIPINLLLSSEEPHLLSHSQYQLDLWENEKSPTSTPRRQQYQWQLKANKSPKSTLLLCGFLLPRCPEQWIKWDSIFLEKIDLFPEDAWLGADLWAGWNNGPEIWEGNQLSKVRRGGRESWTLASNLSDFSCSCGRRECFSCIKSPTLHLALLSVLLCFGSQMLLWRENFFFEWLYL